MPTKIKSLLKYFDDGIVQYWLSDSSSECIYRITVQPSGTTIDKRSLSWNGRECWQVAYTGFSSFMQAEAFLHDLTCVIDKASPPKEQQAFNGHNAIRVSEPVALYRVA